MKYYSEDNVKEMIDYAIAYGTDITSYCPSLDDYPSIEIKEPHGRVIDADKLLKGFSECEMKAYGYNGTCDDCEDVNICRVRVLMEDIKDAPTVLEAST